MTRTAAVALVVAAVALLGGCALDEERHAQVVPADAVPFGLTEADAPPLLPLPPEAPAATASVCFLEGSALTVVDVAVEQPVDLGQLVAALADPPDDARALRTAVGDPSPVRSVGVSGGVAQVDLTPSISTLGGEEQLLAVAQIVCTLTGQPGVGLVSFTVDGAPTDVPRGDGSLTSGAVSRDDYVDVFS